MADDNVFSGFAQGNVQGAQMQDSAFSAAGNYAIQKAQLDQSQQHLEVQKQYLQDAHQQTQVKMGETLWGKLQDYSTTTNPALRKIKQTQLTEFAQRAGVDIDKNYFKGLDDPEIRNQAIAVGKAVADLTNPKNATDQFYSGIIDQLGNAAALDKLGDVGKQLTAYKEAALRAKASENALNFKDTQLDKRQAFQENKAALTAINKDPELVTSQNRINGAIRVQHIIKGVENGTIKGTSQIRNSIANEFAKLEAGSNSTGLGQAQRAEMHNTLMADVNDLTARITGKISKNGSISPDQMKQLKAEVGTLQNSYMEQLDQRHQTLRSGFQYPETQDMVDRKVGELRKTLGKRIPGGWKGLQNQQAEGSAPAAAAQTQAAPQQPPKYSPDLIRRAQAVAQSYVNEKDPAKKAAIAAKAPQYFSDDLRQKVGLP